MNLSDRRATEQKAFPAGEPPPADQSRGGTDMEAWTYRPARDLALAPLERWRSVGREDGLTEALVHRGWWSLVCLYLRTVHRLRVTGREHLPERPPFVVVANHASHLDALVLAAALPRRLRQSALPIAAGDFFFEAPAMAAFAAYCLNALPLWRRRAGRHAMEELRGRLTDEPCGFILFPEGTRSRTGAMGPFKPGLGMLVAATSVPVVPCHIAGAHDAWPPDRRRPQLRPVRVRIGPALRFESASNDREGWNRVARDAEAAVRALADES
jgi:1-acyl-sn-glycerol-3-phosphate acyltransferase